jgi:hypothetical protein
VRGSPVVFPDFSGGLDLVADPADLALNESFDALNVRPTQDGSVYRRDRVSPMGVTFGGQVDYLYAGGIYLFAVGFGRLESLTYNPTVRTVISTSAALNRSSAMFTAPASGGQGPHYFLGQSGALSTDGTTALSYTASAGSLPAAAIAIWHQQRVFAARLLTSATTDPSSTVVASNIGDPRDWTQGTSQGWTAMFGPGDGDPITAMVGAGQYLFVFKRNKVWVVYDLDTGANRRVSADVGAVSGRSVVATPSGIFFYSQRGVMVMDLAGSGVTPISHKIDPAIVLEPLGSYSTYDLYQGAYLNNSYYLAVISVVAGGYATTLWEFDLHHRSWWKHTTPTYAMGVFQPGSGVQPSLIMVGDIGAGTAQNAPGYWGWRWDGTTDFATTAFTSQWTLAPFSAGQPAYRKRFLRARFQGDFSSTTVDAYYDFDTATPTTGLLTATGVNPQLANLGVYRALALRLRNTGSGLKLRSAELTYRMRRD